MNNGQQTGGAGVEFHITGGAGPYEAAAIAAVIEHALAEERRTTSVRPRRFSNWMMVARNDPFVPPRSVSNGSVNGAAQSSAPRATRPSKS